MLEDRVRSLQQRIVDLDKEKYSLQNQVQQKDKEVKSTIEQQKNMSKSAVGNTVKLEQKVTKM